MNERDRRLLTAYEAPAPRERAPLFGRLLGGCLAIAAAGGLLLLSVDVTPAEIVAAARAHRIHWTAPAPAQPIAPATPVAAVRETTPARAADRVAEPAAEPPVPADAPVAAPADAPAPRRVYGVRQVFAKGIAEGGGAPRMGIVVKRGNTLDGVADTLTATAADLGAAPVSLSTVDEAPRPLHRVAPVYSEALLAARASGTVTARLLIDAEGGVADVVVVEDIGYDSRDLAVAAFRQFRFSPARRGGQAVAVWIVHRIRFEFQE